MDLEERESPDSVEDFREESAHAFVDLEERESADTVADFEEESAHTFVDLEERESPDSVADSRRSRQTRCRWISKDDAILSP